MEDQNEHSNHSDKPPKDSGVAARAFTALAVLMTHSMAGVLLGLMWVKLFLPRRQMGWDGIADALGGLMIGGAVGLIAAVVVARVLSLKAQRVAVGVALATLVLSFAFLLLTKKERPVSPAPQVNKSAYQPYFRFRLRLAHTREILDAVAAADRPLVFTDAEMATAKPELIFSGWGPDYVRCEMTPTKQELDQVAESLSALAGASAQRCPTPEQDLIMASSWNYQGTRGNLTVEAECLDDRPTLAAVIAVLESLHQQYCLQ